MKSFRKVMAGALGAGLVVGIAAPAAAQSVPAGPPPAWDALIPCAQKADPAEGFRCYQAAMRAAGYSPNPEIAATERRRRFGLPSLPLISHKPSSKTKTESAQAQSGLRAAAAPEEEPQEDRVTVTLEQVALIPPLNRLLLVTTEGAIWQQTDSETVSPTPKPGSSMTIVHGKISGFFCQFDRVTKVRCVRTH